MAEDNIALKKVKESLENVGKARIEIIEKFISIEGFIEAIITLHFSKEDKHSDFTFKLLGDPSIPSIAKISVLEKIIDATKYPNLGQDLREMNNLRNTMTHSKPVGFQAQILDRKLNPVDVKDLTERFNKLYQELEPVLYNLWVDLANEIRSKKGLDLVPYLK